ncbi:hypothetical protein B0H67DRAFT_486120 [Lasiosphaeris hirsuta]|uniref:Ankyrin repeat protein n=1 Tax=Lasiosphaeris hirsuta TaxID=260670 RepID=A0AA40AQP9_9PEZI|nr:hypothetical protein B0H67DRAFT_486120 [Lasiosphaeris hirsuta]
MESAIDQARRLLQAQRSLHAEEQSFGCFCSPFSFQNDTAFTYQEANSVLSEVVEANGSADVVKALLAFGADINFARRRSSGAWNKITLNQHQGQRSNVLLRATAQCRPDIVRVLAAHADQENLDSVLHHAIGRGDLSVLQALLDHGANPVQLHDDFMNAVYQNQVGLVQALLSGHRLPCLACRSTGLRLSVKNRSLDVTQLLLKCWADVNHDNAVALVDAVEIFRPDIVRALISGPVLPSPRSLDAAVGKAVEIMGEKETRAGQEILEMCLSAGAAGPETTWLVTEGVLHAVRRSHAILLGIILRLRTPPQQYETFALLEAIQAEKVEILLKLLEFQPSPESLTVAVSQAMKIKDTQLRYEVARFLVNAGAQGMCTADGLVKATKLVTAKGERGAETMSDRQINRQLFTLLLSHGVADVDYGQGEALQIAVQASRADLTEEIIARHPSPSTLGAALPWAMKISDRRERYALVHILLRNQICEDAVGRALVDLFKTGPADMRVVELLMSRGSVNYNKGEVFIFAIRCFQPDAFSLLLTQGVSYKALFTAALEALKAPRSNRMIIFRQLLDRLQTDHLNISMKHLTLERDTDLGLVEVLLEAGAEATHEEGVCIKNAAYNFNLDLIRMLSRYSGHHEAIFTQALLGIISRGRQWIAFENLEIVQLLLRHGASGQVVNKALVELVDHVACQDSQMDLGKAFLATLFGAQADVNHDNGKAVGVAAGRGDPFLLSLLLSHGATSATASLALSISIMAHHKESLLLQLIAAFTNQRVGVLDVNHTIPGMLPPILMCLKSYPDSVSLLDSLVNAGCQLEATVPSQVYANEIMKDRDGRPISQGPEPVSVLMWSLLQPGGIRPSVLKRLISHGADVCYTTPRTRANPLLLAARAGRREVVRILLEAGAKVLCKDVLGRSALFFASRSGDVDLATLLLRSKPSVNDGSLHEASRGFHPRVLRLLIKAGHDANFRSTRHEGRTALAEIALHGIVPNDPTDAEEALDILCEAGASPLLKVRCKTVIFLALDNPKNESMTQLLLEKVLYRTINSQENTFQQGIYYYSPTMYVFKGILHGPRSEALIRILRDHGAEDRFYAGPNETQPEDAIGLPEEIKEYERERRSWERQSRRTDEGYVSDSRRTSERVQSSIHAKDVQHERQAGSRRGSEMSQQHQHQRSRGPESMPGTFPQEPKEQEARQRQQSFEGGEKARDRYRLKQDVLYEQDRMVAEKEMREMYHSRDSRERKRREMTALKTQRGDVIGKVDLEELNRWRQREEFMKQEQYGRSLTKMA